MFQQLQDQELKHQPITYKIVNNDTWPLIGTLAGSSQPGGKKNIEVNAQAIMDDLSFLYSQNIKIIYNLVKNSNNTELARHLWQAKFKNTEYITDISGVNITIEDYHAPTQKQLNIITDDIIKRLNKGNNILVHCAAGKGRTGTILTAVYIKLFKVYDSDMAIKYIRKHYHADAVETNEQVEALRIFAQNLRFKTKERDRK